MTKEDPKIFVKSPGGSLCLVCQSHEVVQHGPSAWHRPAKHQVFIGTRISCFWLFLCDRVLCFFLCLVLGSCISSCVVWALSFLLCLVAGVSYLLLNFGVQSLKFLSAFCSPTLAFLTTFRWPSLMFHFVLGVWVSFSPYYFVPISRVSSCLGFWVSPFLLAGVPESHVCSCVQETSPFNYLAARSVVL